MPVREFTDDKGTKWRVWKTRPSISAFYSEEHRNGWLTFESADDRRRLAPVPGEWEDCTPERLQRLCEIASQVATRISGEWDFSNVSTSRMPPEEPREGPATT